MNKPASTYITVRQGPLPGEMSVITAVLHLWPAPPQDLTILNPELEERLRQEAGLEKVVNGDCTIAFTFCSGKDWPVTWFEAMVEVADFINDQHHLDLSQACRIDRISTSETRIVFRHGLPPILVDSKAGDISVKAVIHESRDGLVHFWQLRHPCQLAEGIENVLMQYLLGLDS